MENFINHTNSNHKYLYLISILSVLVPISAIS